MVRAFDSDEVNRTGCPMRFTEIVDCPRCGTAFDADFVDGSISVEDIVDPPTGRHTCPRCEHTWVSEMTGWTFFSEAG